jgi:hypothetical protein
MKSYLRYYLTFNTLLSAEAMIGTHCMLSCVSQLPTELSITWNYTARDMIGNFCSLYFIRKCSGKIDVYPIQYGLMANGLFQVGYLMECSLPLLDIGYFIPISTVANVLKHVAYVYYGALHIQKLQHSKSIGLTYAEFSAYTTLANSVGMGLGLSVLYLVPNQPISVLVGLGMLRAYFHMKSIREPN